MRIVLMFLMTFATAWMVQAADVHSEDEAVIRNKARKRLYAGGSDVEPLKVQAQLPILKVKSEVEGEEPPPPDDVD